MADNNNTTRFLDAAQEPVRILLPIEGYEKEPLVSLERAAEPIKTVLHDLDKMVWIAKKNAHKPSDGLTCDESAAIHLYTMQWEPPHKSLYIVLNEALRSENRNSLKPWFRYLKLLLTALHKLPSTTGTIYRGIRQNVSRQYNESLTWWGFSSCTETITVMEQFIGSAPSRTIFLIKCKSGKAIHAHSFFKKENEILLMPGTYLQVISKWSPDNGLHMIQLEEIDAPYQLIAPPFESSSVHISKHVHHKPNFHSSTSMQSVGEILLLFCNNPVFDYITTVKNLLILFSIDPFTDTIR